MSKQMIEMTAASGPVAEPRRLSTGLAAGGSVLGALAMSSCCVVPLLLFSLGVGGAWIGRLTALAPYQPYFFAVTAFNLAYGYWLVYRARRRSCDPGTACARPSTNRVMLSALVTATLLVAAALAVDLLPALIS